MALPTHSTHKIDAMLTLDSCLQWRVQCNQDEAAAFFAECETYNDHDNAGLLRLASEIDAAVPRMLFPNNNPNNGKRAHKWAVGNEGSRVAYLEISTYAMRGTDIDELLQQLIAIAQSCAADEAWETERSANLVTLRFWWD